MRSFAKCGIPLVDDVLWNSSSDDDNADRTTSEVIKFHRGMHRKYNLPFLRFANMQCVCVVGGGGGVSTYNLVNMAHARRCTALRYSF